MRYLLDTDTCVDLLRGVAPVVAHLKLLAPDDCGMSVITSFELYAGAAKARDPAREIKKITTLVSVIRELSFGTNEAKRAGDLRMQVEKAGTPVGPYDLLIAAHALAVGATLITANTVEFRQVKGLALESWRQR